MIVRHSKTVLTVVALIAVVLPPACANTPATGTHLIGPAGGTITSGDVTLTIPPDALAAEQTISITATDLPAPPGYELFSPIFDFEPAGIRFARPVVVSITFRGPATRARLYWSRASDDGYDETTSMIFGQSASTVVTHFSGGWVGSPLPIDGSSMDAGDAESRDASSIDATGTDGATGDVGSADAGCIGSSCTALDADAVDGSTSSDPESTVTCRYQWGDVCGMPACAIAPVDVSRAHIALFIDRSVGGVSDHHTAASPCAVDSGFPSGYETGRVLHIDADDILGMFRADDFSALALGCLSPSEQWIWEAGGCPSSFIGCDMNANITVAGGDAVSVNLHAAHYDTSPPGCPPGCRREALDCTGSAIATER
jgi:hypothetical protein